MAAAEPLKSEGAAQTPLPSASGYFKAGTIERIFADRGGADGRRLHIISKALLAFFVGKAEKNRDYTFILSEAAICDTLAIDGKTFRKYLAPLTESGLVSIDKNRPDATRRFHCKKIFERYGDDNSTRHATKVSRIGKVSRTDRSGKDSRTEGPLRETAASDRESIPAGSGNQGASLRESIPNPISSSISSTPQSLKERWGLTTEGIDRELAFLADAFAAFALTERKQRALIQRYGVYGVAGAVAYVKEQQQIADVKIPAALLEWALEHGRSAEAERWFGKESRTVEGAPGSAARNDSRTGEVVHVVGDLWSAALTWLEPRMSAAEFNMLVKPSKPVAFDSGTLRLEVQSAWLRDRVNERCASRIAEALEALIGPEVRVEVECADAR